MKPIVTESELRLRSMAAYADINAELRSVRLDLTDEKILQLEIQNVILKRTIYSLEREVRLSKKDIIDFMVLGLGIEVKIKGSKTEIYRQLQRYAEFEEVKCLWLITNKAVKLPEYINGKNAYILNLGAAWL